MRVLKVRFEHVAPLYPLRALQYQLVPVVAVGGGGGVLMSEVPLYSAGRKVMSAKAVGRRPSVGRYNRRIRNTGVPRSNETTLPPWTLIQGYLAQENTLPPRTNIGP